jgi:hypothetical protein
MAIVDLLNRTLPAEFRCSRCPKEDGEVTFHGCSRKKTCFKTDDLVSKHAKGSDCLVGIDDKTDIILFAELKGKSPSASEVEAQIQSIATHVGTKLAQADHPNVRVQVFCRVVSTGAPGYFLGQLKTKLIRFQHQQVRIRRVKNQLATRSLVG